MADRETVITHLQIIRTWAAFARERDLQFFTATHLEKITQWADDALALLKDYDTQLQYCDDHITMYQTEIKRQDEKIKELQSAYDYLQKQFFEVQDKLLKEQEAKCLTKAELDDLNENQFVWIEGRTGYHLYCLQIIGICRGKTGVSDIQFNAPTSYVERSTNRYGKSYRIWTDKPTDKQRQEVKWE